MAANNELAKPDTDDEFEAMCHALYQCMWNDTSCSRVGGKGQVQHGIDILGFDGIRTVGIQCKHYTTKPFTMKTVTDDVTLAENADLPIKHMLFATTAPNKAQLVLDVRKLSDQRRSEGKFTVSIDFWNEITGHLRIYPEIGRAFIKNFPGAPLLDVRDKTCELLQLSKDNGVNANQFQTLVLESQKLIIESLNSRLGTAATPDAAGDEADQRIANSLDLIRDSIRGGKCTDAKRLLESLGNPKQFRDTFSRFRWYTNQATIQQLENQPEMAAKGFLEAFELASDHEKAHINKVHAYLLLKNIETAESFCQSSLVKFPNCAPLWALLLNIRLIKNDSDPEYDLPEIGVSYSMGIQPILMEAHHKGFIEQGAYSEIFMAKLMQNHSFVSIRAEDLYVFAKRMPAKVTDEVKVALESFREPTLDIVSGVRVVCEFLRCAANKLPPTTVISYAKLGLAVLQDGCRQNLSKSIRSVVAFALKDLLQNRKLKLNGLDRQFLESLLESPAVPQFIPQMSPLAQAIQALCRNRKY